MEASRFDPLTSWMSSSCIQVLLQPDKGIISQMAATLTGGDNNSMVLPVTTIIVAYEYILTSTDCIKMLYSTVSLNCYYAKNQFHNMTSSRQANASKAPSSQTKSPQRVRAQRAANPAGLGRSCHKTSSDGRGDLCCVSHAH